jgi:hypothetical protein
MKEVYLVVYGKHILAIFNNLEAAKTIANNLSIAYDRPYKVIIEDVYTSGKEYLKVCPIPS